MWPSPEDEIDPRSTLRELGADSLDHVELVMALEEAFKTEISDKEAQRFLDMTMEEIGEYMKSRVASSARANRKV